MLPLRRAVLSVDMVTPVVVVMIVLTVARVVEPSDEGAAAHFGRHGRSMRMGSGFLGAGVATGVGARLSKSGLSTYGMNSMVVDK
jgi:hypothetical protein